MGGAGWNKKPDKIVWLFCLSRVMLSHLYHQKGNIHCFQNWYYNFIYLKVQRNDVRNFFKNYIFYLKNSCRFLTLCFCVLTCVRACVRAYVRFLVENINDIEMKLSQIKPIAVQLTYYVKFPFRN